MDVDSPGGAGSVLWRAVSRTGLVTAIIVAGALVALASTAQQRRAVRSHDDVRHAEAIVTALRVIDGLEDEWRGRPDESPVDLLAEADLATVMLFETLDAHADAELTELRDEAVRYTDAVGEQLAAIVADDVERANEIDETRVDPGFERVITLANEAAARARARADTAAHNAMVLTWAATLGMAGVLSLFVAALVGARDRREERRRRDDTLQRFRLLLEGTSDVITIVSGDDDYEVMGSSLGALEGLQADGAPMRVREFLRGEAYAQWRVIDQHVRQHGEHEEKELSVVRPDGSRLYVEAHGSRLDASSNERVWVWRDVTMRKELEVQLSHQAFHDSLTGIANRLLLMDRIGHALSRSARSASPVTLLFCDIDDFKAVNDTLGHGYGDQLLTAIAKRIVGCVRPSDTVARLGGDEFAILLEGANTEQAAALGERVLKAVSYEVEVKDHSFYPSMSIGVATALPDTTTEELLRNADLAMYAAKHSGKGRVEVFQDEMHRIADEALHVQAELELAIHENQFVINYQPIVDVGSGEIAGVEASAKWRHPRRGEIELEDFVSIAESTGMIIPIGRIVLLEACRAGVVLQRDCARPIQVHVTAWPRQVRDPAMVNTVREALGASGLAASRLVIEIPEGALLDDATAVDRLEELSELGVQIGIDRFGSGYWSIDDLGRLPVKVLKIDRAFVSGEALEASERNAFLHAILGLAKSLDLATVARGVDTAEHLELLRSVECGAGQGDLWAPPESLAAARARVRALSSASRAV